MSILTEGLGYMDMENQLEDKITVDEYAAKMGDDEDIVTLTFTTKSELAAKDLVGWFEKGYDFVLDASTSEGEIRPGRWLVFVEMDRRSKVPERIITLLKDLDTLTGIKLKDWTVEVDDEDYEADEDQLAEVIILNPNVYAKEKEEDLNEMRTIAGLPTKDFYDKKDPEIEALRTIAGF